MNMSHNTINATRIPTARQSLHSIILTAGSVAEARVLMMANGGDTDSADADVECPDRQTHHNAGGEWWSMVSIAVLT